MPAVKCSVDGCGARLQPLVKPDPRDRESWVYRECDVCFKPVCEKHATEVAGNLVCDRCRREQAATLPGPELLDLGLGPLHGRARPGPG